jgi:hypothetical protein
MSTPSPDYGEPWYYDDDLDLALTRNGSAGDERRIVECVNACKGMADPAVEIEAMRAKLARLSRLIDVADKANEDQSDVQVALSASFAEAVAYVEIDRLDEENKAMRAAIEEAETSLTDIAEYWNQDENESAMSDACWHAVGTAKKAITKLQPFLTQES